ncbi:putative ribonuclease H-like domain-containing protein [Tanacetum coccineum]
MTTPHPIPFPATTPRVGVFSPFVIISDHDDEITTLPVRPAPPSPDRTSALYGYPLDSGDDSSYEDPSDTAESLHTQTTSTSVVHSPPTRSLPTSPTLARRPRKNILMPLGYRAAMDRWRAAPSSNWYPLLPSELPSSSRRRHTISSEPKQRDVKVSYTRGKALSRLYANIVLRLLWPSVWTSHLGIYIEMVSPEEEMKNQKENQVTEQWKKKTLVEILVGNMIGVSRRICSSRDVQSTNFWSEDQNNTPLEGFPRETIVYDSRLTWHNFIFNSLIRRSAHRLPAGDYVNPNACEGRMSTDILGFALTQFLYRVQEIIEEGNSFKPVARTTANEDSTSTTTIPDVVTAEEKILKKNDLKAQSILMMTLPSEHLLTFNKHKDSKSLFEAIEARFGGNEATKKTQKTLLKKMYETFNASSSESLNSIFNRLQKIVSQLTILGLDDSVYMTEKWDTDSDNDSVFRPKSDQTKPKFTKINFVKSGANVKSINKENTHRQVEYPRKTVTTKSGQVPVNAAKQSSPRAATSISTARHVNTAAPKLKMNDVLPTIYSYFKAHSSVRRAINQKSAAKTYNFNEKVNTARVNNVTTAGPKAVVSATEGNGENAVKSSTCWVWRPTGNVIDHNSKYSGSYMLKRFDYVDLQGGLKHDNMYSFDLKNVVPSGGLTCLFAKATIDESNLWHRRLGHINFKTMNKLVKGNLVRGLPSKLFENDHTCVACQKGKQHKASCKTKLVSSISQPLQMLHMDLFGLTSVRSINHKTYCLVVTDDFSRFSWVFFLATKDETSGILKTFITSIENQINHKVKIIICDNGTEFKNNDMNQFYGMKGIKREFSVARTPQQNRVAKRKNRTLIETRVLVTKPHNKIPYELLHGRPPSISFMRPFRCPVTILNTLDPLGKFDRKADKGFLVGCSINSKAFRVFNTRTRKVEENLHITFLENKPNVVGSGPDWLFDIDLLTNSMNYEPVTAGNQTNKNVGIKNNVDEVPTQQYILLPLLYDSPQSSEDAVVDDAGKKTNEKLANKGEINGQEKEGGASNKEGVQNVQDFRAELDNLLVQQKEGYATSTNRVSTISPSVSAARQSLDNANDLPTDPLMPDLDDTTDLLNTGIFSGAYDDEDVGAEADLNNLETTMNVSPIPITRIYKDHPKDQIIRDINSATQTRMMTKISEEHAMVSYINKQRRTNYKDYQNCLFAYFLSQIESKKVIQALKDSSWIEAMQDELLQFRLHKDWRLVDLPKGKHAIGTKWVYRNKKDERGIVVRNKARLVAQDDAQEILDEFYGELTFFLGLQVKQKDDGIFISQDKFQVTPKVSHLHAVKRIFIYLKGQPKLGLWYLRDSPFDLEAFFDSDYARASLDRKSTIGGCQFPGKRLISWQCKKQTIVANSTTEAEYVATANYYGQTGTVKTVDNGEQEITATIDDKEFTVTKASVRRHLQLADVEAVKKVNENGSHQKTQTPRQALKEVTELPETSEPISNVPNEAIYEEWDDRVERATTTAASLDAAQASGSITKTQPTAIPNVPLSYEISTGSSPSTVGAAVTTAGASISTTSPLRVSTSKDISTAETLVYIRRSAAKDKGKAKMDESEPEQTKTKLQQRQERAGYEAAPTMRRVGAFVPTETEIRREVPELAAGSSKRDADKNLIKGVLRGKRLVKTQNQLKNQKRKKMYVAAKLLWNKIMSLSRETFRGRYTDAERPRRSRLISDVPSFRAFLIGTTSIHAMQLSPKLLVILDNSLLDDIKVRQSLSIPLVIPLFDYEFEHSPHTLEMLTSFRNPFHEDMPTNSTMTLTCHLITRHSFGK